MRPSLSEWVRDVAARLPGGRRLSAELAQSRRQRDQLRAQVEQFRERLRWHRSEHEVLRQVLPVRRAALLASPPPAAAAADEAFALRTPAYREALAASSGAVRRIDGLLWHVPEGEADGRLAAERLRLPLEEISQARMLAAGRVMLDVGAHIGMTSIPRAILGHFDRIYAAEPDEVNFGCLVRNIAEHGVRGLVLPDRLAIGDREAELPLQSGGSGTHHLVAGALPEGKAAVPVPVLTLDGWLARLGVAADEVGFVKVDTQGWEPLVLAGATGLLARRHTVWQIEYCPSMLRRAGFSADRLKALLGAHFTHLIDLRAEDGPRSRPVTEFEAVAAGVAASGRSYTNLLLFNA